jgi:hypothetical protein
MDLVCLECRRVVDEERDRAERRARPVENGSERAEIGQVRFDHFSLPPFCSHRLFERVRLLARPVAVDRHGVALLREARHDGAPDPSGASGHQCRTHRNLPADRRERPP